MTESDKNNSGIYQGALFYCGECGKNQHEARAMVALREPRRYVCDECALLICVAAARRNADQLASVPVAELERLTQVERGANLFRLQMSLLFGAIDQAREQFDMTNPDHPKGDRACETN